MREFEALIARIAKGPPITSACGTGGKFFEHTTSGFARFRQPQNGLVNAEAAAERHQHLAEHTAEERAVLNLALTIEDATGCRLDSFVLLDIWRRALAAYTGDDHE